MENLLRILQLLQLVLHLNLLLFYFSLQVVELTFDLTVCAAWKMLNILSELSTIY